MQSIGGNAYKLPLALIKLRGATPEEITFEKRIEKKFFPL